MRDRNIQIGGGVGLLLAGGRVCLQFLGASTVVGDAQDLPQNLGATFELIRRFPIEWAYLAAIVSAALLVAPVLVDSVNFLARLIRRQLKRQTGAGPYISHYLVQSVQEEILDLFRETSFGGTPHERIRGGAVNVLHRYSPLMSDLKKNRIDIDIPDGEPYWQAVCFGFYLRGIDPWIKAGDIKAARAAAESVKLELRSLVEANEVPALADIVREMQG